MKYEPALDGLRGCAVCGVVLAHLSRKFSGGILGVDLFFVLSGFLITSLLLQERSEKGRIDLQSFYIRRAFRLMPATLCALTLGGIAVSVTHDNLGGWSYPGCAALVLCYVSNWAAAFEPNALGYLSHAWSLSIEEQFYLVWPLATALALRKGLKIRALRIALSIAVFLVCAYRAVAAIAGVSCVSLYYQTLSRADAIMIGCLGAVVRSEMPDHRALIWLADKRTAQISAGLLVLAAFFVDRESRGLYFGGFSAVATMGLSLVLFATSPKARGGTFYRILATRPLVMIGKVSYGLYLYHWIIFAWVRHYETGLRLSRIEVAAEVILSFALTVLSYLFVEQPAMRRRVEFARSLNRHFERQ